MTADIMKVAAAAKCEFFHQQLQQPQKKAQCWCKSTQPLFISSATIRQAAPKHLASPTIMQRMLPSRSVGAEGQAASECMLTHCLKATYADASAQNTPEVQLLPSQAVVVFPDGASATRRAQRFHPEAGECGQVKSPHALSHSKSRVHGGQACGQLMLVMIIADHACIILVAFVIQSFGIPHHVCEWSACSSRWGQPT